MVLLHHAIIGNSPKYSAQSTEYHDAVFFGQTGLTPTRKRKATDHPTITWEAQRYMYVIIHTSIKEGKPSEDKLSQTESPYPTKLHVDVMVIVHVHVYCVCVCMYMYHY